MPRNEPGASGFVAKLTQLFAVYVVYIFLSGWTFFDYYYREFGVDPRWLDLPAQEILVKGFTVLLTPGFWLWPIYVAMITVPLAVDGIPKLHERIPARMAVGAFLFLALFAVYFASRSAGSAEARIDKGGSTRLPLILFSRKPCPAPKAAGQQPCDFKGSVLALRNGLYYIHKVTAVNDPMGRSIALSVFRTEDLTDIQIVEH